VASLAESSVVGKTANLEPMTVSVVLPLVSSWQPCGEPQHQMLPFIVDLSNNPDQIAWRVQFQFLGKVNDGD